jgi:hypothetical protein
MVVSAADVATRRARGTSRALTDTSLRPTSRAPIVQESVRRDTRRCRDMIEVHNVTKRYGEKVAVDDLSFSTTSTPRPSVVRLRATG